MNLHLSIFTTTHITLTDVQLRDALSDVLEERRARVLARERVEQLVRAHREHLRTYFVSIQYIITLEYT